MYERIEELEKEYIKSDGIALFSWYRFACFVVSNEPALTERLVQFALETIAKPSNTTASDGSEPAAAQVKPIG